MLGQAPVQILGDACIQAAELQLAIAEHVDHVVRMGVQRDFLARFEAHLKDPYAVVLKQQLVNVWPHLHGVLGQGEAYCQPYDE